MKSVYVSSTLEDLRPHRAAVYQGLRSMRYDVKAMEDYVAMDGPMVNAVMTDVGSCDIYVGIFAWRYGYVPPDANPDHLSITELEYRQAGAANKPRLIFLLDPAAPWSPKFMDAGSENNNASQIQRLRKELATLMHSEFYARRPRAEGSGRGPSCRRQGQVSALVRRHRQRVVSDDDELGATGK